MTKYVGFQLGVRRGNVVAVDFNLVSDVGSVDWPSNFVPDMLAYHMCTRQVC